MRLKETRTLLGELAVLLESGVSVHQALESFSRLGRGTLSRYADRVAARLGAGDTLADAMRRVHGGPSLAVIAVVDAGERSGKLPEMLRRVEAEVERQLALRARLAQRLAYPALCAVVAVAGLPLFLVFQGRVAAYLTIQALVFGPAVLLVVFAMRAMTTRGSSAETSSGRWVEGIVDRVPVIGRALRQSSLGSALRLLGLLVGAGVDLATAIPLVARTAPSARVRDVLSTLADSVGRGRTLTEGLERVEDIPDDVRISVHTGEQSGTLERALEQSGTRVIDQTWRRLDVVVQLLPVALTLLLGVVALLAALAVMGKLGRFL